MNKQHTFVGADATSDKPPPPPPKKIHP